MKTKVTIEIDLTSDSGHPMQLEYKVDEIVGSIKHVVELERFSEDNRIVYNGWDDPHVCELTISMEVGDV